MIGSRRRHNARRVPVDGALDQVGVPAARRASPTLVVDRRCQPQTRAAVDRMLASLDDPREREAYLRSIRGEAWGAVAS